jgi:hypothetical protein
MAYSTTAVRVGRTAILMTRGLGAAFLVFSITTACYLVPVYQAERQAALTGERLGQQTFIQESYWTYLLPCLFEFGAAIACLAFSRPIGRLFARGLAD